MDRDSIRERENTPLGTFFCTTYTNLGANLPSTNFSETTLRVLFH